MRAPPSSVVTKHHSVAALSKHQHSVAFSRIKQALQITQTTHPSWPVNQVKLMLRVYRFQTGVWLEVANSLEARVVLCSHCIACHWLIVRLRGCPARASRIRSQNFGARETFPKLITFPSSSALPVIASVAWLSKNTRAPSRSCFLAGNRVVGASRYDDVLRVAQSHRRLAQCCSCGSPNSDENEPR